MYKKRSAFGKIIAKACIDRDLSIKDASKIVGVSYATLHTACSETGVPSKRLVQKCSDSLGLTITEYEAAMKCANAMPRTVVFGLGGLTEEKREKIIALGKIIKRVSVQDIDSILNKY